MGQMKKYLAASVWRAGFCALCVLSIFCFWPTTTKAATGCLFPSAWDTFTDVSPGQQLSDIMYNKLQCAAEKSQSRVLSLPFSGLPGAGEAGRIARLTDTTRGLWMDQGLTWFSLSGKTVNVQEFGARGDGVTDDTAAIQAALTAGAGSSVFVPPGTYIFLSPLQIRNGTTFFGVYGQSVLKIANGAWNSGNFNLPPVTNQDTTTGRDVVVRNLVLDGNDAGNPTPGAPGVILAFRGTLTRFEISGVIFKNYPGATAGPPIGGAPLGIGVAGGTNAISDGLVANNIFLNTKGGALVVFGPRNRILYNSQPNGGTDASFGAQGSAARGNVFKGNIVKDLTTAQMFSFYVEGASENLFEGNVIDNSNGIAISDFNIAKPQRNIFLGNAFINSPPGAAFANFIQSGVGLGASDNIVIHNMGSTISSDPAYVISGTVGKNLVKVIDQGNGFEGWVDTAASTNRQKWLGMDGLGRLTFMNNSKTVLAYFDEGGLALKNSKPLKIEDSGGTARTMFFMGAGDLLEIGSGMVAGEVALSAAGRDIRWMVPLVTLGGGASATLGTIGGAGPATAAQNSWMRVKDASGVAFWVPAWK